tara:strand:+ start:3268 stop:5313 length:2046 start_codon:yes stop_codon:yes gene_type:complete
MENLIIISNEVDDSEVIINSLNAKTTSIIYNKEYDFKIMSLDIINLIKQKNIKENSLASIAWMFHGQMHSTINISKDMFCELNDINSSAESWDNIVDFINKLKIFLKPECKFIHLLSCCLYNTSHYIHIAKYIKEHCEIELTASDNLTGNIKYNADWIMESHKIDVKELYFTDNIKNYGHTLNKLSGPSISTSNVGVPLNSFNPSDPVGTDPVGTNPVDSTIPNNWRHDTDKASYRLYNEMSVLHDACFDFQYKLNNSEENVKSIANTILPIYSAITQLKTLYETFKSIKEVTKLVTEKFGGGTPLSKCIRKLAYTFADKHLTKLENFINTKTLKIDKVNELMSEYLKEKLNGIVSNKVDTVKDQVIDKCLNLYKDLRVPYIVQPSDTVRGFPYIHSIMSQALEIKTDLDKCQFERYKSLGTIFSSNPVENKFNNHKFESDCEKYLELYKTKHIEHYANTSMTTSWTSYKNSYPHADRFIYNQMKSMLNVLTEVDNVVENIAGPFKEIEPLAKSIDLPFLDDLNSILSFINDCQGIIPNWLEIKMKAIEVLMDVIGIDTLIEDLFDEIISHIPQPTINIDFNKFADLFDKLDINLLQNFIDDMKDKCIKFNSCVMRKEYYGVRLMGQSCIDLPYRIVDRSNVSYELMNIWMGDNRDCFIFNLRNGRYIPLPSGVTYSSGPR